jgi:hypothetical protein
VSVAALAALEPAAESVPSVEDEEDHTPDLLPLTMCPWAGDEAARERAAA